MRIWDLPPKILCSKHLLGEHLELHCIWTILTEGRKGYSHHPETLRWKGKLKALYKRHDELVKEMKSRGYNHKSNLNKAQATGEEKQDLFLQTPKEQVEILRGKNCECEV